MISKYFDFKMSDEKAILVQVHELQVIVNKLCAVKIDLRFVLPGDEHKVCRLVKSLCGLKQVHNQWHEKFDTVILSNIFVNNKSIKRFYTKVSGDIVKNICLYVNDMLIISNKIKAY